MLGMAVESFAPTGTLNPPGEPGELVCVRPFPCMPLGFWPLPGFGTEVEIKAAQDRFYQSYFSEFKDVWCEYHSSCAIYTPKDKQITGITLSSHVRSLAMEAA